MAMRWIPTPLPMLVAFNVVILMTLPPLGPLVQREPGPVTVTVPFEPTANPTELPPLLTVPPS